MDGMQVLGFKGKVVRYGISNEAEIYATDIGLVETSSVFLLHLGDKTIEVRPKISGKFNIYNLLAAASVGYLFHVDIEKIKHALESFIGVPMRFEMKEMKGMRIISDVYNANPGSMEEAIKELVRLTTGMIIAVLNLPFDGSCRCKCLWRELVMWMSDLP